MGVVMEQWAKQQQKQEYKDTFKSLVHGQVGEAKTHVHNAGFYGHTKSDWHHVNKALQKIPGTNQATTISLPASVGQASSPVTMTTAPTAVSSTRSFGTATSTTSPAHVKTVRSVGVATSPLAAVGTPSHVHRVQ